MIRRTLAAAVLLLAALGASAQTTLVEGIKYDNQLNLGGSRLMLNGAGVRYKLMFRVYTAGLYLGNKATTAEAALSTPGPKRMHIVMLRDIDANELGKLFTRGMQDNSTREQFAKSIPGTLWLADLFSRKKKLVKGEYFFVDYVPGVGTNVLVNGVPQGEPVREPEFFNALLRIWLGSAPADARLKEALLGKAPEQADMFRN